MLRRTLFPLLLAAVTLLPVDAQQARRRPAQRQDKTAKYDPSDNVKRIADVVYAQAEGRELLLDLYLPGKPAAQPAPCIVVIHGGGWRSGDKSRFASKAAWLADHGFAAACIGYRLLPSASFPAPVEDCKAAVRWVRANAEKYGIDRDRIGAFGGSASAHLAAMLATSHKAPALEGTGGNLGVSSRIAAAVALATPTDMRRYAERSGLSAELAELISPITHVDADSAPILLIHSKTDNLVPCQMSVDLAAKYKEAGVEARLELIEQAPHAFWNQEQWFEDTMESSLKFFNKYLLKKPSAEPRG